MAKKSSFRNLKLFPKASKRKQDKRDAKNKQYQKNAADFRSHQKKVKSIFG